MKSHPDRCATTLANVAAERQARGDGPFAPPGADARDCRIDLKLLQWQALRACGRSSTARARLDEFDQMLRPDLWAGTVQDGTALGFAAALHEAISLAPPEPSPPEPPDDPVRSQVFEGKPLRRKKDLLVKSGGARLRFSRKLGLSFVDRKAETNVPNFLRFEARRDRGTLDEFRPDEGERARLFSAQFLQPVRYETGPERTRLWLRGRLGRTAAGWSCELVCTGDERLPTVQLDLTLDQQQVGQRLRARFLGVDPDLIAHHCTDVREIVQNDFGGFTAFTLVRSVDVLRIDGVGVAVPGASCRGRLHHRFGLGTQRVDPP